jgi:hypothetical protein
VIAIRPLIVLAAAALLAGGYLQPARKSTPAAPPAERHLRADGTIFRAADGRPFQWRGITAFRLLDYVAHGRERDADALLTWAAAKGVTVVRVLAMGGGFMDLRPADGRAAAPRLLEMAARRGIHVEVVALAGTLEMPVNLEEHVIGLGRILAQHPNAVLEIANEPEHPTQAPDVHKPEVLARLAAALPAEVPVALGSVERGEGFAAGRYVTWHVPRESGSGGWAHVLAIAEGAAFLRRWNKPVVSDEPIGAGARYEPGRRDNMPARLRAGALLTRLAGLGATFHYEAGLQARAPAGRELECFNAWNEAWTLLPPDLEHDGTFRRAGDTGAIVRSFARPVALDVFERQRGAFAWVLVVNPRGDPALEWQDGWVPVTTKRLEGAWVITARRR